MEMKINQSLEGKRVQIIDIEGKIFEGVVSEYIYPEDNEPEGIAAIDIEDCPQSPGMLIGFNETEIRSIEVVE